MDIEQIIEIIESDYAIITNPKRQFNKDFLKGYYACILDLKILAKKTEVEKAKTDQG